MSTHGVTLTEQYARTVEASTGARFTAHALDVVANMLEADGELLAHALLELSDATGCSTLTLHTALLEVRA